MAGMKVSAVMGMACTEEGCIGSEGRTERELIVHDRYEEMSRLLTMLWKRMVRCQMG